MPAYTPPAAPFNGGSQTIVSQWAETPAIEPGEVLNIDLVIDPVNPYRRQTYTFTINSRSPEQQETTLISEQGQTEIKGISWFRQFVPRFTIILLTLLFILVIAYITLWRLTGLDIFGWLTGI